MEPRRRNPLRRYPTAVCISVLHFGLTQSKTRALNSPEGAPRGPSVIPSYDGDRSGPRAPASRTATGEPCLGRPTEFLRLVGTILVPIVPLVLTMMPLEELVRLLHGMCSEKADCRLDHRRQCRNCLGGPDSEHRSLDFVLWSSVACLSSESLWREGIDQAERADTRPATILPSDGRAATAGSD